MFRKVMTVTALLLALVFAVGASAYTVTSADIEHPIFPWSEYTLQVDLFTDDPEQVQYNGAPEGTTPVLIALSCLSGQIATSDIEEKSGVFVLRDSAGDQHDPASWRVRGISFTDGEFSTKDKQDGFELIYLLPSDVPVGGATLVIDPTAKERVVVRMPEKNAEQAEADVDSKEAPASVSDATKQAASVAPVIPQIPADAPVHDPAKQLLPAGVKGIAIPANKFVDDLLAGEAEKTDDPWVRAILLRESSDAAYEDGKLRFNLCSMNPDLADLGDYASSKEDYILYLHENTWRYDLECALPATYENGEYGVTDADVQALLKTVKSAAAKTKAAFDDKRVRVAVADYLFKAETIYMDFNRDMEMSAYEPLIAAQVKQSLDVSDGPSALTLKCTGADIEALVEAGYTAALDALSKKAYANAMEYGEIEEAFREELISKAEQMKKKNAKMVTFTFNIDELLDKDTYDPGEAFMGYLDVYEEAYREKMSELSERVADMPDIPALDFPKSGRVEGSTSGTLVNFRIPSDGMARYIQMREVESDEAKVSAFIRPGGKASVRVPRGDYYILVGIGQTWYGPELLFGEDAIYSRTEDLEIKSSNYYHTITLGGATDGNMASYGADLSDFS